MNERGDRSGISPSASAIRQNMVRSHVELIEMAYADALSKWGDIPVILVMDPQDSCARLICEGLNEWITKEAIAAVLKKAIERRERPTLVCPVGMEVAMSDSFCSEQMHEAIKAARGKAICTVVVALEGKTFMTLPLPPKGVSPEEV